MNNECLAYLLETPCRPDLIQFLLFPFTEEKKEKNKVKGKKETKKVKRKEKQKTENKEKR